MIKRGIYTPVPTFLKKDLKTIDIDTQIKHARFLKENGISGLVVMGSTGELAHLSRTERHQVVSALHRELPDFPIFGGVGQHSVGDALDEIQSLKDAGASLALVLPSSYYGASVSQQGIVDWYTEVADKAVLPVVVYVYPGVTNNTVVHPRTIKTLSAHRNIVGTKMSHGDLAHHAMVGLDAEIAANNFVCLTGLGQVLLPALSVGFAGTVDALSGAFPRLYVRILECFDRGDMEEARNLQLVATRGEELVVRFGVVGIKRAIHEATGLGETYLGRAPLNHDVAGWAEYADYLEGCIATELHM